MFKDQNISLEYGGVRFDEPLLYFMEQHLRVGIPPMQIQCLNLVQDFMVKFSNLDTLSSVSYNAKRSTYGSAQHLNAFEEFIGIYKQQPRFRVFSEFANDPHHRIDAQRNHGHVSNTNEMVEYVEAIRWSPDIMTLVNKMGVFADRMTAATGDVVGFWFDHEGGASMIGLDLSAAIDRTVHFPI